MRSNNVKKILYIDIFVLLSHTIGIRTVNISRHATLTPQPGIAATHADDRTRIESPELFYVRLNDLSHVAKRITRLRLGIVDLFHRDLGIASSNLLDLRQDKRLVIADGQPEIGFELAQTRDHVDLQASIDAANIQRDPLERLACPFTQGPLDPVHAL